MMARSNSNRSKLAMVLGASTLALYLPVLWHGFVQYDDQQYVTENPQVQAGLTLKGLRWAFGFHAGNWHPLTWISHMLDCQLFGAWAGGHHLTNILLHAESTVILFLALERMTGKLWRAAAVAALFGWHPLHVESVAWVAERKDVLCGFFWMLTIWGYAGYARGFKVQGLRFKVFYGLTVGFFVCALMAKPMAVTLPFVLLLLDGWPLGSAECGVRSGGMGMKKAGARGWRWLVLEKVPLFLLAAGGCWLTVMAQREAIVSTKGLTIGERGAHTILAYAHYLWTAFVPVHLAAYYPYETGTQSGAVVLAGVALAGITIMALKFARQRPYLAVGWFWFLGTLVPVIGLVQVGDQAWADRYTYLPLVGVFIMVVWAVADGLEARFNGRRRGEEFLTSLSSRAESQSLVTSTPTIFTMPLVLAAVVGMGMVIGTSRQIGYWKDTRTLFEHAYRVTHENYMALTVLGSELAQQDKLPEAIEDYRLALRWKPTFPEAHFFLGNALEKQGQNAQALAEYQQALWFKPISEQTHIFMGMLLGKQLKYDEAVEHYRAALKINADSPVAHNNLARVLHSQGKLDEAIEHYTAALALDPKLALAHNNLGILYLQRGRTDEGVKELREALRLKPDNVETEYNLGLALNQQSQWGAAAELFAKSVGASLPDAKAHYEYATALSHLGKTRDALGQYASALLLQPDFPDALNGLAWILATSPDAAFRNGMEAVKMAERACDLTGRKSAEKLRTLGAAYAEEGRFDEAIRTTEAAQDLAGATQGGLVKECGEMVAAFKGGKAWRTASQ